MIGVIIILVLLMILVLKITIKNTHNTTLMQGALMQDARDSYVVEKVPRNF